MISSHTYIECECGTHALRIESEKIPRTKITQPTKIIYASQSRNIFQDVQLPPVPLSIKEGTPDKIETDLTFYLDIYNHLNLKHNIFTRIKHALKYILTGRFDHDQIILTPEEASKLSSFINNA